MTCDMVGDPGGKSGMQDVRVAKNIQARPPIDTIALMSAGLATRIESPRRDDRHLWDQQDKLPGI
ncbi:MAG: hypothetical protein VB861_17155 [Planctomycetaceae bacterium]